MFKLRLFKDTRILALVAFAALTPFAAHAADEAKKPTDILPPVMHEESSAPSQGAPILRLTPDKSEIITLERVAGSIIIGNPTHLNILADSPTRIVLVPRIPGATHFTVLDKKGDVIDERHVIVGSPKDGYVRVKRVCREDSAGCTNTSVFYCPDMCHEIGVMTPETTQDGGQTDGSEGSSGENPQDMINEEVDAATE